MRICIFHTNNIKSQMTTLCLHSGLPVVSFNDGLHKVPDLLNSYHAVLVSNPTVPIHHDHVLRVLQKVNVPIVAYLSGFNHVGPETRQIIGLCKGVISTTKFITKRQKHAFKDVPYVDLDGRLPYVPTLRDRRKAKTMIVPGKLTQGNGAMVAAEAAEYMPEGWTMEIWGADVIDRNGSRRDQIYDWLTGYRGWFGSQDGLTWLITKNGRTVKYGPQYDVYPSGQVALCLKSRLVQQGWLEYEALQALDAGMQLISPMDVKDYDFTQVDFITPTMFDQIGLAKAVQVPRSVNVTKNRKALCELHNPRRLVSAIERLI